MNCISCKIKNIIKNNIIIINNKMYCIKCFNNFHIN